MILTFESISGINYDGSGKVLVGLLDFKSSGPAESGTVGSIPMHFRHHTLKRPNGAEDEGGWWFPRELTLKLESGDEAFHGSVEG